MKDTRSRLQDSLTSKHIPALDGMRAVAVFLVIFYHFGFDWVPGAHGVMIFFVLSGFLITRLLLLENEKSGRVSLKAFYLRRVLRIFPAFYCYWGILVAFLLLTGKQILWPHAWSALSYLSNYYVALNGDPNNGFSHTWSLGIEEQFYLLWPALFLVLRRNLARMTSFLTYLIGAVWLYRALLCFWLELNQAYFYAAFDARMDHLMIGCLLAVLVQTRALNSFWQAISSNMFAPLITLALLISSIYLDFTLGFDYRDVVGFAVEPVLIALLLAQLISLHSTLLWSWLDSSIACYLGRISYSLYLYQQITLHPAKKILSGQPVLVQLVAAIVVTITVASGSYYLIERPFLKLKTLWSKPRDLSRDYRDAASFILSRTHQAEVRSPRYG